MPRARPSLSVLLTSGMLLLMATAPCALTWRAWRQERQNQELIAAIRREDISLARNLLAQGAEASARTLRRPLSLHQLLAAMRPSEEPSLVKVRDESALELAIGSNDRPAVMVSLLLKHGAKINTQDMNRALRHAAQHQETEVVGLLLDQGADLRATDEGGNTALILAAVSEEVKTTRLLLDRGADVNAADDNGETALMRAAYSGCENTVRLLIARGANVNARFCGMSVLGYARQNTTDEVIRILRRAGAK